MAVHLQLRRAPPAEELASAQSLLLSENSKACHNMHLPSHHICTRVASLKKVLLLSTGGCHAVEEVQGQVQWESLGSNLGLPQTDG